MNKLNFVSCVSWVGRGLAKEIPTKLNLTKEEIKSKIDENQRKLKELTGEDSTEKMETDLEQSMANDNDDDQQIIDRYNLENYDAEEEEEDGSSVDENDPYFNRETQFSDDEEEKNDNDIKPTDNLVLVGHVEEDYVSLEIKVYNEEDGAYVHHEIYLTAYPLCFEWLDFNGNLDDRVNFVAVGDMNKDINIWDLDTIDVLDPFKTLIGHQDSVLDISWSPNTRHWLASVSADQTFRLWDLEKNLSIRKLDSFRSNVQTVGFHPIEPNIVLTGDCKGRASLIDCQSESVKKWKVCKDELEKVLWNRHSPYQFMCATSTGHVYALDCRNENSHLFVIKAHNQMISGLDFSCSCQNFMVTASADKTVKVWDVQPNEAKFIKEINPQIGTILSIAANPDLPFVFAISGDNSSENFKILNFSTFTNVVNHFH